jgi:iron complex outermembrane receptor protein
MKKITLLLFFIVLNNVFAQKQISGNVKDDKNEPLFGVNVIEKGTSNGVSTDVDGNFKTIHFYKEDVLAHQRKSYKPGLER